ncbi:MAG: hypothetical protein PHC34_03465 [Candidatus Gastranaerophilales bacterium]|nr:hypothetical protein [Candidatus Gastranaerophilales bacterium]
MQKKSVNFFPVSYLKLDGNAPRFMSIIEAFESIKDSLHKPCNENDEFSLQGLCNSF